MPAKTPVPFVTPLKVYDNGAVPPEPLSVTVAVPPLHGIGMLTDAVPVTIVGWDTVSVPVTGVQLYTSVMLQLYGPPAGMPVNIPVELVTPLNLYERGAVPPVPISVTVAVPPLHSIGDVTDALPPIAAGSVIVRVPDTGPQLLASVMLHEYPTPAVTPVNIPVVFVTPLKVYDNGAVPPEPLRVTVAVPPLQYIVVAETEPERIAG